MDKNKENHDMPRDDKESIREKHRQEREEINEIKDSLRLGTCDKLYAIVTGNFKPTKVAAANSVTEPEPEHWDDEAFARQMASNAGLSLTTGEPITKTASKTTNKSKLNEEQIKTAEAITPLLDQLDNVKLSSNPEMLQRQITAIMKGVKASLLNEFAKQVADNSKKCADNVEKTFKTQEGIKIIYKTSNDKLVSVEAKGLFLGDESIYLQEKEGNAVGFVLRMGKSCGLEDISANFEIKLKLC